MKRREFMKSAGIMSAGVSVLPNISFGANDKKELDMVAIHGGETVAMFEKGIAEMGGMQRFVKAGQTVVLKPNIGWDRTEDYGANTDAALLGAITKHCFKAGAKEVLCFDHTCGNDWENRYSISGIKDAIESNGGKMVGGNTKNMYVEAEISQGVSLKKALVHKLAVKPDVFINIPVLKNHSGAKITCALKNYMGCIWDRGWWHKNDMPQCIADYSTFQKTTLTIVDAYRVMLDHGPRGKSPDFAPVVKYQLISTDIVAADTAATNIFSALAAQYEKGKVFELADIKYIPLAEKLKVGTTDLSKLNVKKIEMA